MEGGGTGGAILAWYGQWLAAALLRRGRGWGRRRVGADAAAGGGEGVGGEVSAGVRTNTRDPLRPG